MQKCNTDILNMQIMRLYLRCSKANFCIIESDFYMSFIYYITMHLYFNQNKTCININVVLTTCLVMESELLS